MAAHRPAGSLRRRLRVGLLPVPGQSVGLTALTGLLTTVLASVPLVLGATQEGAWDLSQDRATRAELGVVAVSAAAPADISETDGDVQFVPAGPLSGVDRFAEDVTAASVAAGSGDPTFAIRLRSPLVITSADGDRVRTRLLHRDQATDNVSVVDGAATPDGVLIPRLMAELLGVGPGDLLVVGPAEASTGLAVSGVYADLRAPLSEYWAQQQPVVLPPPDPSPQVENLPYGVVLAPPELLLATADALRRDVVLEWFSPLPAGLDVDAARAQASGVDRLGLDLSAPTSPVAAAASRDGFPLPRPGSGLAEQLASVDRTVQQVGTPVRTVGLAGAVAALVLVGGWAAQRLRRREDEIVSLVTRGLSPTRAAGRALREAVAPLLVGAAGGVAVAVGLVRAVGPAPDLPAGTWLQVAGWVGCGLATAAVAVASVTAGLVARSGQLAPGPVAQVANRVPWLPVCGAVAVITAVPVLTGAVGSRRIGVETLVLPLLATLVLAGVVTAALPALGRWAAEPLRRLPTGPYLVSRRILAAPAGTRLVVVTTALSVGLVLYAGALESSTARAVQVASVVAAPSDVVVPLARRVAADGDLPRGASVVSRQEDVVLTPGGLTADLLGVDPAGLGELVRWDTALATRPLEDLLADLDGLVDGRVPVLIAGDVPDGDALAVGRDLDLAFGTLYDFPVRVVDRVAAFPGQQSRRPVVVLSDATLVAALDDDGRNPERLLDREVWAPGGTEEVLAALSAGGYAYVEDAVNAGREQVSGPDVVASGWSMGYLRAVAVGAGLLGLLGLVGHGSATRRRRAVADLLLTRAGMSRRRSDRMAGLETGVLAGLAGLVAVLAALPAAQVVLPALDPLPMLPPGTVFQVPWSTIAAVAAGVGCAILGTVVAVGRRARSDRAGQVLRDSG